MFWLSTVLQLCSSREVARTCASHVVTSGAYRDPNLSAFARRHGCTLGLDAHAPSDHAAVARTRVGSTDEDAGARSRCPAAPAFAGGALFVRGDTCGSSTSYCNLTLSKSAKDSPEIDKDPHHKYIVGYVQMQITYSLITFKRL
jgi:hypothetical protein